MFARIRQMRDNDRLAPNVIAERLGVSDTALHTAWSRYRSGRLKFTHVAADKERTVREQMFLSGSNLSDIARARNVSPAAVSLGFTRSGFDAEVRRSMRKKS